MGYSLGCSFGSAIASPRSAPDNNDQAPPRDKPDIILIVLDDFGYGYLAANFDRRGVAGISPEILARDAGRYDPNTVLQVMGNAMPYVNHLVSEGMRFSNAYASSSLCATSRVSILTARHSARFGLYTNEDVQQAGMPSGATYDYPAKAIRRAGYATCAVGKWHGREQKWPLVKFDDPLNAGFDSFYGFNSHASSYYKSKIIFQAQAGQAYRRAEQGAGVFLTDQFTSQAVAALKKKRRGDPPIFLYLAYNAVHAPLSPSARAPKAYEFSNTGNRPADLLASYMRAVDAGIERIMATQQARGRANSTLLMFVADNGSPGSGSYVAPSNSPTVGYKGQQFEGGLKVPMFAVWPGRIKGATTYDGLVSAMDLMATAMQAAGVAATGSGSLDGIPLQRLFGGDWPNGDQHHSELFMLGHNASAWGLPDYGHVDSPDVVPGAWMVRGGDRVLYYTGNDRYLTPGTGFGGSPKRSFYAASDSFLGRDLYAIERAKAQALEARFWSWFDALPDPAFSGFAKYWQDLIAAHPNKAKRELRQRRVASLSMGAFDPRREALCATD